MNSSSPTIHDAQDTSLAIDLLLTLAEGKSFFVSSWHPSDPLRRAMYRKKQMIEADYNKSFSITSKKCFYNNGKEFYYCITPALTYANPSDSLGEQLQI